MNQQTSIPTAPVTSPLVDFWNDTLAPKFIRYRHVLEGGLSRHSETVFPMLGVEQGQRILDVGCGFGDTTIALAHATGPMGSVLGVDCCHAFLDLARQDAEHENVSNVTFCCADVEQGLDDPRFDMVFARFGTMFFANPVAGLRAIRACLNPGGRFAHIVWRQRDDNPWLITARDIVRQYLPPPGENAVTCGPGPFSMADEAVTHAQMRTAGFADIRFERVDAKVLVGRDIADAVAFQLAIGPAGETFREAGPTGEEKRPEIEAALAAMFEDVRDREGGLWMDSSSWLITATNPA